MNYGISIIFLSTFSGWIYLKNVLTVDSAVGLNGTWPQKHNFPFLTLPFLAMLNMIHHKNESFIKNLWNPSIFFTKPTLYNCLLLQEIYQTDIRIYREASGIIKGATLSPSKNVKIFLPFLGGRGYFFYFETFSKCRTSNVNFNLIEVSSKPLIYFPLTKNVDCSKDIQGHYNSG